MPDNQNIAVDWLTRQSLADIRQMLTGAALVSYEHAYGFTVVRVEESVVPAWQVRVHLWPPQSVQHQRIAANGVRDQQVHAHGWELHSVVIVGALAETSYSTSFDAKHKSAIFKVESTYGAGESRLTLERSGVSVIGTVRERGVGEGCYTIAKGRFHSTVNALESWTLSLVLTETSTEPSWLIADPALKVTTNQRRESPDAMKLDEVLSDGALNNSRDGRRPNG